MSFYITKASGQEQLFDQKKFTRSLERSGASSETVQALLEQLKQQTDFRTTKDIYRWALKQLKKENLPVAARYNLKQALLQLGPSGFPFEKFIAHLMRAQGYTAQTNQVLNGRCVDHEVDLVFFDNDSYNFAECKFHNSQKLTTAVQVPLYTKSRFDDVASLWISQQKYAQQKHNAWVITNTRFTSEAIKFGTCVGLKLLSWSYPEDLSLCKLIDTYGVHPITALTTLTTKQKKHLITNNFLLCKDVHKHIGQLKELGIKGVKLEQVIAEAEGVCKL